MSSLLEDAARVNGDSVPCCHDLFDVLVIGGGSITSTALERVELAEALNCIEGLKSNNPGIVAAIVPSAPEESDAVREIGSGRLVVGNGSITVQADNLTKDELQAVIDAANPTRSMASDEEGDNASLDASEAVDDSEAEEDDDDAAESIVSDLFSNIEHPNPVQCEVGKVRADTLRKVLRDHLRRIDRSLDHVWNSADVGIVGKSLKVISESFDDFSDVAHGVSNFDEAIDGGWTNEQLEESLGLRESADEDDDDLAADAVADCVRARIPAFDRAWNLHKEATQTALREQLERILDAVTWVYGPIGIGLCAKSLRELVVGLTNGKSEEFELALNGDRSHTELEYRIGLLSEKQYEERLSGEEGGAE